MPKSINEYKALFNDPVTGKFRTNAAQIIDSYASQANVTEIADGFVNKLDGLGLFPIDPTAGIALDFGVSLEFERKFYLLSSLSGPKTITTVNDTYAGRYTVHMNITDPLAVLEFPDHIMNDSNWEPTGKTWTPPFTGKWTAKSEWDSTAWRLTITGPYA